MRVLQPRRRADLLKETFSAEGAAELVAEHLEGDLAVVLQMAAL